MTSEYARGFQMGMHGTWIDLNRVVSIKMQPPPASENIPDTDGDDDDDEPLRRRPYYVWLAITFIGNKEPTLYKWYDKGYVVIHNDLYVPLMKAWANIDIPKIQETPQ